MIYLDNAATTKLDQRVFAAMLPYLTEEYGNPGGQYALGRKAKDAIEKAREQVAAMIGADPDEIVFTSGGTESNNMVMNHLESVPSIDGGWKLVTSATEHHSILRRAFDKETGWSTISTVVNPGSDGVVTLDIISKAVSEKTGLVSVMHTNNETGVENEVAKIGKYCSEYGIMFHTDCVQAAGTKKLDVNELNCDYLSLSSHKIHGPKGVGALYVRETIYPMIFGGSDQEFGRRGGTENVPGIVGFGKACEIVTKEMKEIRQKISELYEQFYYRLRERIADAGLSNTFHVNGGLFIPWNKVINIRFDGVDGETLRTMLDANGICVSAGSACQSLEQKPSHVLTAMGLSDEDARNSIRVSFSRMNTEEEVLSAADTIVQCVKMLRGFV